jgi:hypothetical protein
MKTISKISKLIFMIIDIVAERTSDGVTKTTTSSSSTGNT